MCTPSSWLHQSCDSLVCFSFSFVLGSVSHFLPLPPPPRLVSFSLHWCFSVWQVPVPFLLCGGSWLGCAVVPVKGALFQSRGWLPIVEAPGYSRHPTSTLAMQLLNGKKKRLQFLTQSYSILWPPLHNGHLSTTASFFGRQSIHWLLFQPLYNGHFILSPRWPLWREIRKCTYFWKLPGSRFKRFVAHTPWFMLVTWSHISKSKGHHMYTCRVSFLNFPHLLQRFINNAGTS